MPTVEKTIQPDIQHLFDEIAAPSRMTVDQTHKTYYRSLLFTTQGGLNPLVNAATPILVLMAQLKDNHIPTLSDLQQSFSHELKAFNSQLDVSGSAQEEAQLAKLLVMAAIDHLFARYHIGERSQQPHLCQRVEQLLHNHQGNLELLELAYLLLQFSFANDNTHAQSLLHKLYPLINDAYRAPPSPPTAPPKTQPSDQRGSFLFLLALIACIVLTFFVGFSYMLNLATLPLTEQLQTIVLDLQSSVDEL